MKLDQWLHRLNNLTLALPLSFPPFHSSLPSFGPQAFRRQQSPQNLADTSKLITSLTVDTNLLHTWAPACPCNTTSEAQWGLSVDWFASVISVRLQLAAAAGSGNGASGGAGGAVVFTMSRIRCFGEELKALNVCPPGPSSISSPSSLLCGSSLSSMYIFSSENVYVPGSCLVLHPLSLVPCWGMQTSSAPRLQIPKWVL